MKIVVTGGTGSVGSAVVRELLERDVEVTVLTRSADKAKNLPEAVAGVVGDLAEPVTVRSVFKGAEGVFLVNTVSMREAHEGLMAVAGMREAGVKRVAYLSVQDADRAAYLPHFGAKLAVEAALRSTEIGSTILRPNNFYQNDYYFKDAMLQHGVYPQPLGSAGLSRVDVGDIAQVAAIALVEGGHEGRSYDIVGPEVVTGESTAAEWSRALGRPIAYAGDDLDAWEEQALGWLPPFVAYDYRQMYDFFQRHGLKATDAAVERLTELLGRAPRSFADFAAETAKAWAA